MSEEQTYSVRELVSALEGHVVLTPSFARALCQRMNIPFDDMLVWTWQTRRQAWESYGMIPTAAGPGQAVGALELTYHIAEQLGLDRPGRGFSGKEFQARANREAILAYLDAKAGEV